MSAWGKADNKSVSGTVTLTAPAITFNGATGHAAGVYTSAAHPFQLGDPVAYANGGGTSVVGLTSGSTYYVTNVTTNTFMVAASEADALHNNPTVIASTDGSGASHTFTLSLDYGRGTLTGTDTLFVTDLLLVNDIVRVGTQEMIVIAVASETVATVINANPGTTLTTFSGQTYRAHEKPTFVASVGSTDFESTQVFGVRSTEIHGDQAGGYVSAVSLIQGGTRYLEVPAVGFSGGGGSSAAATATIAAGSVTAIAVTNNGSSYETAPTVNLSVPRRTIPTTGVNTTTEAITYANHGLTAGEEIKYYHNGGTELAGLTNGTSYYPGQVNSSAFILYNTAARGANAVANMTIATTGVNTTTNVFTSTAHGLVNGAELNYNNAGGTSITGLTTALTVAQGGTGAATLTANNVVLGNGTSAVQFVAPGSSGNVLVSPTVILMALIPLLPPATCFMPWVFRSNTLVFMPLSKPREPTKTFMLSIGFQVYGWVEVKAPVFSWPTVG